MTWELFISSILPRCLMVFWFLVRISLSVEFCHQCIMRFLIFLLRIFVALLSRLQKEWLVFPPDSLLWQTKLGKPPHQYPRASSLFVWIFGKVPFNPFAFIFSRKFFSLIRLITLSMIKPSFFVPLSHISTPVCGLVYFFHKNYIVSFSSSSVRGISSASLALSNSVSSSMISS